MSAGLLMSEGCSVEMSKSSARDWPDREFFRSGLKPNRNESIPPRGTFRLLVALLVAWGSREEREQDVGAQSF
jgi:hypothetical protein